VTKACNENNSLGSRGITTYSIGGFTAAYPLFGFLPLLLTSSNETTGQKLLKSLCHV